MGGVATFTTTAAVADVADLDVVYVNGQGPFVAGDMSGSTFTATTDKFLAGGAAAGWTVHEAAANTQISAGSVILMDGRRDKLMVSGQTHQTLMVSVKAAVHGVSEACVSSTG